MSAAATFVRKNRDRHLSELMEVLRIPSVSTDPARAGEVKRAASWVKARLARAGCTKTEIFETKRHPIVYGEWLGAPGKPTVLVYGHYDVQPEDPIDLWTSPAFQPTIRDGRLYARGACDDKGQFIIHINAFEAEAYCAWARRRLPSAAEWERASAHMQWGHSVWEWTADAFEPYPGFKPGPYREYSAPWFGDHRELRGGAFASHARMHDPRYRNFFQPQRSDVFAGFRSVAL